MYLFDISDGVTTINLNDCTAIGVEGDGYAPAVSRFEEGGYIDVTERVTLRIKAASGTAVLTRANELKNMIDQANRFSQGENVRPVIMRYQLTSTSTIWYALILAGTLVLPGNFVSQDGYKLMWPVSLNIERRGAWLSTDRSNLILNGGFENWLGDPLVPKDWTILQGTSAQVTRNANTDFVTEGIYSVKLDPDTGAGHSVVEITQEISSTEIPHGVEVLITFDAYVAIGTPSGSVPFLSINVYGESNVSAAVIDTGGEFVTKSITVVSGTDSTSPATNGVRINFAVLDVDDIVAYVDNVRVVAVASPNLPGDVAVAPASGDNGDVNILQFASPTPALPEPVNIITQAWLGTNHATAYMIVSERRGNGLTAINRFLGTEFATPWGAAFTSVSDSAQFPTHGTNVLRYTPTVTTEVVNKIAELDRRITTTAVAPVVALLAKVRNNSASASYILRTRINRMDSTEYGKPVVIEPSASAAPQVVMLGVVEGPDGSDVDLGIRATATGAGTLDIDTFYLVYLTPHTYIIRIDKGAGARTQSASAVYALYYNHNLLSLPVPSVTAVSIAHNGAWSASRLELYQRSNLVDVCYLGTGRTSTANTWRMVTGAGVVATQGWTMSRLPTTLIPK